MQQIYHSQISKYAPLVLKTNILTKNSLFNLLVWVIVSFDDKQNVRNRIIYMKKLKKLMIWDFSKKSYSLTSECLEAYFLLVSIETVWFEN